MVKRINSATTCPFWGCPNYVTTGCCVTKPMREPIIMTRTPVPRKSAKGRANMPQARTQGSRTQTSRKNRVPTPSPTSSQGSATAFPTTRPTISPTISHSTPDMKVSSADIVRATCPGFHKCAVKKKPPNGIVHYLQCRFAGCECKIKVEFPDASELSVNCVTFYGSPHCHDCRDPQTHVTNYANPRPGVSTRNCV